jgi:membrane protease YdiL (CAAX protease family)
VPFVRLSSGESPRLDLVSYFLIGLALIIFLYGSTYTSESALSGASIVGLAILGAGVAGIHLNGGFSRDPSLSPGELGGSAGMIMISLVAVAGVNYGAQLVTFSVEQAPVTMGLYLAMIGVAEEVFFRGFLLSFAASRLGDVLGVLVSAGMGAVYHAQVYGWSNQNLAIVFGSFAVLGFAYVASGRRLSVPMVAHAAVNLLSALG